MCIRDRNIAEVLSHPDSHGGAEPSRDGVEPSSLAASLCRGSGRAKQRWIRDQRYRVKRDTDGIEDGGQCNMMRVKQKQTCEAKRNKRDGENKREASTGQKPSAGQSCSKMQ